MNKEEVIKKIFEVIDKETFPDGCIDMDADELKEKILKTL
jgi:hypothetical protein